MRKTLVVLMMLISFGAFAERKVVAVDSQKTSFFSSQYQAAIYCAQAFCDETHFITEFTVVDDRSNPFDEVLKEYKDYSRVVFHFDNGDKIIFEKLWTDSEWVFCEITQFYKIGAEKED